MFVPYTDNVHKNSVLYTHNDVIEITLLGESHSDGHPELLQETLGYAVVDSGCTRTVCGRVWLQSYIDSLSRSDRRSVHKDYDKCNFRFGDGEIHTSTEMVTIPVQFGSQGVKLRTHVVNCDVPLLLSRDSLKRADAEIEFKTDTIVLLGEKMNVLVTSSGHLCVPLGNNDKSLSVKQVLFSTPLKPEDDSANERKITKLHKQFAHPSADRLKTLIRNAGMENAGIERIVNSVSEACDICKRFRKAPPRPAVGFPMATEFNETVAMDIKYILGQPVLHMIDHVSRYSSGCRVSNKKPQTIVNTILTHWIRIFGSPVQFLTDNGGEFVNQELIELCEKFNIILKTTAAESPWSNGLCERHNAVIGNMVEKITTDSNCSLDIAIQWAISAKNALSTVYGFAPNQLVFGRNVNLPDVHKDRLPAQNATGSSSLIARHLIALHKARQAFITQESCEKLRRALNKQTRTFSDTVYQNGEHVYYKRNKSSEWHGPAKVLGRDSAQYLLKHGGVYVRVHPCKMQHVEAPTQGTDKAQVASSKTYVDSSTQFEERLSVESDSDEETHSPNVGPPSPPPTPAHLPPPTPAHLPRDEPQNISPNSAQIHEQSQDISTVAVNLQDKIGESGNLSVSGDDSGKGKEGTSKPKKMSRALTRLQDYNNPGKTDMDSSEQRSQETKESEDVKKTKICRSRPVPELHHEKSSKFVSSPKDLPYVDTNIEYRLEGTEHWKTAHVISKGGKSTTANWHFLNIKPLDDISDAHCVSFKNAEWMLNEIANNREVEDIFYGSSTDSARFDNAKQQEIQKWKDLGTFVEVEDTGQSRVSTRWVCTEKLKGGKLTLKARLVARGFEEDSSQLRTDSPTCSKESLRMVLCILAGNNWELKTIDIKSAYLQGHPISRDLFLQPPNDAKTEKLWKLLKTPYGLVDAGRHWYIRVLKEFTALGAHMVQCDQAIFIWKDPNGNGPCAILAAHVDDFLYGGNTFFYDNILPKIREVFEIGTEESNNMKYLGLAVKQTPAHISLSTDSYCSGLKEMDSTNLGPDKSRCLDLEEVAELRKISGQINWVATQSRPDVAFDNCVIGNSIKNATVTTAKMLNKVIRKLRSEEVSLLFPSKMDLDSCEIICFCDSGFANLPDCGSQEGIITFLIDQKGYYCIIAWYSKRIKRVVNSSLAAECLAAVDAAETSILLRAKLTELLCPSDRTIRISLLSDSKSLVDNVHSSTSVDNKRLQIDVAILREMVQKGEISQFRWISTKHQVANALTKNGASSDYLLRILRCQLRYDHSSGIFI